METEFQKKRKERARAKTAGLRRKAERTFEASREETRHIPMGQPILVGHHSEKRHRRTLERSDAKMRKGVELSHAADRAEDAARNAGRAISSDDPEALVALRAKLAKLEAERELLKAINKAYRKGGFDAVAKIEGVTEDFVADLRRTMELCPWKDKPADTKNLSANIRRVKKRLETMEREADREPTEDIEGDGWRIEECPADNRIRFYFDEKPSREVCRLMRSEGFKFSRKAMAWQRHLNANGRAACLRVAEELGA